MTAVSCDRVATAPPPAPVAYSGEDLYRGLVFGAGDAGQRVPQIRDLWASAPQMTDPQMRLAFIGFQNRLVAEMRAIEPAFFDGFASDVQSGNPVMVNRAFVNAARLSRSAIEHLPEIQEMRQQLKNDPRVMQQLTAAMTPNVTKLRASRQQGDAAPAVQPDAAAISKAMAAQIANSLDSPSNEAAGIVVFLPIAAWVVLYFQVAVVQDLALALDVWRWIAIWSDLWVPFVQMPNVNTMEREELMLSIADHFALAGGDGAARVAPALR